MNKIEELSQILSDMFIKFGNDESVVRLSQYLDKLIVEEQKNKYIDYLGIIKKKELKYEI